MTSDQATLVMTEKSSKPQAIQSNSRQALAPETLPTVIFYNDNYSQPEVPNKVSARSEGKFHCNMGTYA